MKYRYARLLCNGAEVILKETKEVITVIETEIDTESRSVWITSEDGSVFHHTEVKS